MELDSDDQRPSDSLPCLRSNTANTPIQNLNPDSIESADSPTLTNSSYPERALKKLAGDYEDSIDPASSCSSDRLDSGDADTQPGSERENLKENGETPPAVARLPVLSRVVSYHLKIDDDEAQRRRRRQSVQDRLARTVTHAKHWGRFTFRGRLDDGAQDWWFAGTAIPLLAATIAPLANVLSIAALVGTWRVNLLDAQGNMLEQIEGTAIADPHWCYALNFTSLICGYVGNLFLLMNFTNRIRYILALPATIFLWFVSTFILVGITVSLHVYDPPVANQTYSQSFWYAVISAILYLLCSVILMINMLGYFLGHYQEHFNLTEAQRTLILQTFLFFIWLAGGAGVFSTVETKYGTAGPWSYANALYFCDVTILTVGFGDLVPTDDVGRGLVLPYAVGGIIMLGLMISSISSFAAELGKDNIVKARINRMREKTLERTVTAEGLSTQGSGGDNYHTRAHDQLHSRRRPLTSAQLKQVKISGPTNLRHNEKVVRSRPNLSRTITPEVPARDFQDASSKDAPSKEPHAPGGRFVRQLKRTNTAIWAHAQLPKFQRHKETRLRILREEKDRFDEMRRLQHGNARFKKWAALTISLLVFGILWAVGAIVFWQVESQVQDFSYFDALYFCYVSLLTIGYGDFTPKSSAGRPFFVVWSLLAIPSITILISDMSSTVVHSFKKTTSSIADLTILPKYGVWRDVLNRYPWLLHWLQRRAEERAAEKRLEEGFEVGPDPDQDDEAGTAIFPTPTIDELAKEETDQPTKHQLATRLASAIRKTAADVRSQPKKKYSYEEWVQFTELIRFSRRKSVVSRENTEDAIGVRRRRTTSTNEDDEGEGLIEWDWIGDDSPMLADRTESEWILERLCESMGRFLKYHVDPTAIEDDEGSKEVENHTDTDFATTLNTGAGTDASPGIGIGAGSNEPQRVASGPDGSL